MYWISVPNPLSKSCSIEERFSAVMEATSKAAARDRSASQPPLRSRVESTATPSLQTSVMRSIEWGLPSKSPFWQPRSAVRGLMQQLTSSFSLRRRSITPQGRMWTLSAESCSREVSAARAARGASLKLASPAPGMVLCSSEKGAEERRRQPWLVMPGMIRGSPSGGSLPSRHSITSLSTPMPFCSKKTLLSLVSRALTRATASAVWCAFTVTNRFSIVWPTGTVWSEPSTSAW
mmetsp:Transcript_24130/g.67110  ORF Transcript_24130/g.67110 Transcript_24130/m.67110 type:complete len:234 (-) Transcript_24130:458-1159(-)